MSKITTYNIKKRLCYNKFKIRFIKQGLFDIKRKLLIGSRTCFEKSLFIAINRYLLIYMIVFTNRKVQVICMKNSTKIRNKIFSIAVAFSMVVGIMTGLKLNSSTSGAATRKCYTINTYNTRVYSNTALTRGYGWIYPTDQVTVILVTGRYSKVSYPAGNRTKTGYIPTSAILTATGGTTYTSRGRFNTYKRDGGSYYGYVANGDNVMVLGNRGNYTQIKYPVSGGYKYAFALSSDVEINLKSTQQADSSNTTFNQTVSAASGDVKQNIYNLAQNSVGTNGRFYQKWYGVNSATPYCAIYAVYIARTAMANAGYSTASINSIVPKYASTSLWAEYYNNLGRYYSFASWYNSGTKVSMNKNINVDNYTPNVGDLAAIDNSGDITPDHTGIVIAVNGNSLTMAEGNTGYGTNATRKVKIYTYYKSGSYWYRSDYSRAHAIGFANPAY